MNKQQNDASPSTKGRADVEISASVAARLDLLEYRVADLQRNLEIQMSRQVVTLDEGFIGLRSVNGWLVLGGEEFRSVLHLADGRAGHEPGTTQLLKRLIQAGDRVADIGAHVGLMSLPMAYAVGAEGQVIAIEPNPRSAEALRRTLVANGLIDRCVIHVVAASDADGSASYYEGINSMLGSLTPVDGIKSRIVETRTMDSLLPAGESLSLAKIDVEGAETAVVRGMSRVIADNPDIIIIAEFGLSHLERNHQTPEEWIGAFTATGLTQIHVIDEHTLACRPLTDTNLRDTYSLNLMFTRPDNPRAASLRDISPVSAPASLSS